MRREDEEILNLRRRSSRRLGVLQQAFEPDHDCHDGKQDMGRIKAKSTSSQLKDRLKWLPHLSGKNLFLLKNRKLSVSVS